MFRARRRGKTPSSRSLAHAPPRARFDFLRRAHGVAALETSPARSSLGRGRDLSRTTTRGRAGGSRRGGRIRPASHRSARTGHNARLHDVVRCPMGGPDTVDGLWTTFVDTTTAQLAAPHRRGPLGEASPSVAGPDARAGRRPARHGPPSAGPEQSTTRGLRLLDVLARSADVDALPRAPRPRTERLPASPAPGVRWAEQRPAAPRGDARSKIRSPFLEGQGLS